MLTMTKLVCGCLGVGALLFLGSSVSQTSITGILPHSLGASSDGGGAFIQSGLSAIGPAAERAVAEFTANLDSLAGSGISFVRNNTGSARLQLQSMAASLPSQLAVDKWLPNSTLSWLRSGAETAAQASGNQTKKLAKKVPGVRSAVRSANGHIASVHPPLHGAAAGF